MEDESDMMDQMEGQEYVEGDMMDEGYDNDMMDGEEGDQMMDDDEMMDVVSKPLNLINVFECVTDFIFLFQYGDEDEENSFGFDNDPQYADFPSLDPRRKVRREIMKTINEMRDKFERPNVHMDIMTNAAAENYAEFLLREEENE